MSKVKSAPNIESIIDEMQQLSEEDQRTLAGAVLQNRNLEALSKNSKIILVPKGRSKKDLNELFVS